MHKAIVMAGGQGSRLWPLTAARPRLHPQVVRPIRGAAQRGSVTLLYSARDTEHNNAVAPDGGEALDRRAQ